MNFGILGLNARNLLYIKKFNPQKQIRFVHDKFKTKEFLEQRGVPVPETYARICTREELFSTDFSKLPSPTYVIKPNKGSQGKGIFIVKNTEKDNTKNKTQLQQKTSRRQKIGSLANTMTDPTMEIHPNNYHIGNNTFDDISFKKKLFGIIDGQYTLGDAPDTILVEEKLVPGHDFEMFCDHGLADIRIILFNMVPIAAMLRMPTEESEGKANLAQGGIGFGIDIGTGRITNMAKKKGRVFTGVFPPAYKHFQKAHIPFREELLLFSANAQYFLNIGYIGLDWVISNKGPKLLEVNGRTGIEIQNITQKPLRRIIDRIYDLHVPRPEKGVEIAKSLFAGEKTTPHATKIVFLSQNATLESSSHETTHTIDTIAIANIKKKKNYISPSLAKKLGNPRSLLIKLPDSDIRTSITVHESDHIKGNKIELGNLFLQKYLIKPIHKSQAQSKYIHPSKIIEAELDEIQIFDQKIGELNRKMSLASCIKPTNYLAELDTFITKRGRYDPTFTYNYPSNKKIHDREQKLTKIEEAYSTKAFESKFAQLLSNKLRELHTKLNLIKAYKQQDYDKIKSYNETFFGALDMERLGLAEEKIKEPKTWTKKDLGKKLSLPKIIETIEAYLKAKKINNIAIEKNSTTLSRISIVYKNAKAHIRLMSNTRCVFREKELEAKLAHEIDVHLTRYLNASKTGWNILQQGTESYIADEEGLAIREAEKVLQKHIPTYENKNIYKNYVYTYQAQQLTFRKLAEFISVQEGDNIYQNKLLTLFNRTLKFKKGIQHTGSRHPGCCYLKDKVYLDGYLRIQKFVEEHGDLEQLLIGKVKVSDLDFIV